MALLHGLGLATAVRRALGLKTVSSPVSELYETVQPVYEVRRISQVEDRLYHGQQLVATTAGAATPPLGNFGGVTLANPKPANGPGFLGVVERVIVNNNNAGAQMFKFSPGITAAAFSNTGIKRDTRALPFANSNLGTNATSVPALPNPNLIIEEWQIAGSSFYSGAMDVVIAPGGFLTCFVAAANIAAFDVTFIWREVPVEAPEQLNP